MNMWTVGALAVAGLALAGCETLNGPEAVANADAQRTQCKVVQYDTTYQSMRMQNQKGTDGTPMQQTEGKLAIGRLKANEPRVLQNPVAPGDSITSQLQRSC
ncbi:MAG: hypothetical protein JSS46_08310 [Proteobacteria bacterium]|nr:hypothetical protein [Pseudomonadota bacterium]